MVSAPGGSRLPAARRSFATVRGRGGRSAGPRAVPDRVPAHETRDESHRGPGATLPYRQADRNPPAMPAHPFDATLIRSICSRRGATAGGPARRPASNANSASATRTRRAARDDRASPRSRVAHDGPPITPTGLADGLEVGSLLRPGVAHYAPHGRFAPDAAHAICNVILGSPRRPCRRLRRGSTLLLRKRGVKFPRVSLSIHNLHFPTPKTDRDQSPTTP